MPTTVTVTGSAGAIGYAILFRISSAQMLGPGEQLRLGLMEIGPARRAVESGKMTKDLALLIGDDQDFLTTQQFLDAVEENLKQEMNA